MPENDHDQPRPPGACPTDPGDKEETGKAGVGNLSPGGASRTGGATTGVAADHDPNNRAEGLKDEDVHRTE